VAMYSQPKQLDIEIIEAETVTHKTNKRK